MTLTLAVLLVGLSAVACLTQSMPVLKIKPPPNILSYVTYRYRSVFGVLAALVAVLLLATWAASAVQGRLAPAAVFVAGAIWVSLVGTPAILFRPFRGTARILAARDAGMVSDDGTVIGVVLNGSARAYPEPMLMPQHVIADEIDGERIVVSWCPLCHSGMVFDGALHGQPIDPRVVGGGNNNVLIYDATSKNMFQQITGEILEGPDKGNHLNAIPSMITTWREWRTEHSDTTVWWCPPGSLFESVSRTLTLWAPTTILAKKKPFYVMDRPFDDRLECTEMVSGIEIGKRRKAYPSTRLAHEPVGNDAIERVPIAVFSKDGGAIVRFFDRRLGESLLRFQSASADDGVRGIVARDVESGTGWSLDGVAVDGPNRGISLKPIAGITRCFWFAFAHFYPDAEIWDGRSGLEEGLRGAITAAVEDPAERRQLRLGRE